MSWRRSLISAAASGSLLALCFPKPDLHWLSWVSLVPAMTSAADLRISIKKAAISGFVLGLVFYTALLYWLFPFVSYGFAIVLAGLVLGISYLSLYTSLFMAASRWMRDRIKGIRWALFASALWTGLEFLRSLGTFGFPWGVLGYSQYKNIYILQLASLFSVYSISFLLAFVNGLLAEGILERRRLPYIVAAASIGFALAYGFSSVKPINSTEHIRVSVIQGNIDQNQKWDLRYRSQTLNTFLRLTRISALARPDLIVWPETAVPGYLRYDPWLRGAIMDIASETGAFMLVGADDVEYSGGERKFFNSAFLVSPKGEVLGKYDKIHLVPFGEYVPYKSIFFFVEKIVVGEGDFSGGDDYTVFSMGKGRFGTIICYEAIFPWLVRGFVERGAQFIVNITNDAWFGRTSAPYQHAAMSVFRAVENRVSLVRCANTGVSMFVDPYGRIYKKTGIFEERVITWDLPIVKCRSFYMKVKEGFPIACIALSMFGAIIRLKGSARR
jgi:apolipoprotein N-acyltransferase